MKSSRYIEGLLATFAVLQLGAGCTESTDSDPPAGAPLARFVASERSSADLGVATWEVWPGDGTDVQVIGRDPSSARRVELIVRRDDAAPDARVEIEAVFPDLGTLHLTHDGLIEEAPADDLRRLAQDVHADLGAHAVPVADEGESGISTAELGLDSRGVIHMGWNLWSYYWVTTVGGPCRPGTVRDHAEVSADYGGLGLWFGWVTNNTPTDCTAKIYTYVNAGHWDDFHWSVLTNI